MKLLFDENLSARRARDLADLYPQSSHVTSLGLGGAGVGMIWARAAADGFAFVTKDEDFQRLRVLMGAPRLGNCATPDVIRLLRG
ncbi:DUF5615 family PIN-like protein [Gemmatimonas sp.]|uniref:DUF5615 family PIN-like protein n=1 Tax=Gemmatimonas sp. TaxID=1962908 RepID=UPI003561702B